MKRIFLTNEADAYIEIINLLGYKTKSNKKSLIKGFSVSSFEKVDNSPLSDEFIKQYMPKSIYPLFYSIVLVIIAILLATAFLVLNFTVINDYNRLIYFFSLMVPTFLLIMGATILSFFRYFNTLRNIRCLASKALILKEKEKHV